MSQKACLDVLVPSLQDCGERRALPADRMQTVRKLKLFAIPEMMEEADDMERSIVRTLVLLLDNTTSMSSKVFSLVRFKTTMERIATAFLVCLPRFLSSISSRTKFFVLHCARRPKKSSPSSYGLILLLADNVSALRIFSSLIFIQSMMILFTPWCMDSHRYFQGQSDEKNTSEDKAWRMMSIFSTFPSIAAFTFSIMRL